MSLQWCGATCGQVGHLLQPVRRHGQQAPVGHRHDEQGPVGAPAQSGGLVRYLGDGLGGAGVRVEGDDAVAVHVGEPEAAVVPAGALGEGQAVEHGDEGLRHRIGT